MALNPNLAPMYFILAPAYHGATMLAWRLNHHPDVVSLGTNNPLRDEEQNCSCGRTVADCPFWTDIRTVLELSPEDPINTYLPQAPVLTRNKTLNTWLNSILSLIANEVSPKCWKVVYEQAERFFAKHDKFLTACRERMAYRAFVDAERSNLKFMTLTTMGFPVKGVIHLTRDPRAYAAIWKKYYPESTVEKPTLEWVAAHTRIKRLKSLFPKVAFLQVRYEDMLANPIETQEKITTFMRQKVTERGTHWVDPMKDHQVGLGPQDTMDGFAPRDENWRESLHPEDAERVLKAAGPLFSEFGYKRENIT